MTLRNFIADIAYFQLSCTSTPRYGHPPPMSVDALINRIGTMHDTYRAPGRRHGINDDLINICRATALVVLSIINIVYEQVEVPAAVIA